MQSEGKQVCARTGPSLDTKRSWHNQVSLLLCAALRRYLAFWLFEEFHESCYNEELQESKSGLRDYFQVFFPSPMNICKVLSKTAVKKAGCTCACAACRLFGQEQVMRTVQTERPRHAGL